MHLDALFRQTHFLTSAARLEQAPPDQGFEVAFAGRSNAGKSSAINVLCDQRNLARASKTPGRTQLLNFFAMDPERRLVDLPGYGYAKVGLALKRQWQGTLARYLEQRVCLRGLVLMVDSRHGPKETDLQLLDWAAHIGLPIHMLLTKADKLSRSQGKAQLLRQQAALAAVPHLELQLFSAQARQGLSEARQAIAGMLGLATVDAEGNPVSG
jgi:GTP-binding protein